MLSDSQKYWKDRSEALDGLIGETIDMVDIKTLCEKINPNDPGHAELDPVFEQIIVDARNHEVAVLEACSQALGNLKQFSSAVLQFFQEGFYVRPRKLALSGEYSPPMVLNTLITEISNDLEIFQRTLHQRQLPNDNMTGHLFILSVGDRVASAALQPAFDAKYLRKGIVATQLGDDFSIRLIPYYDMLLIEVPFTTGSILTNGSIIPVPGTEHLGILHEVGHHVYRYGKVPGTQLSFEEFLTRQLFEQGITGGLANWLEEIFADMYGLLVGGPVMVLSYQELLSRKPRSYLMEDTGEHPIPILRPLILTRAMKLIKSGTASASKVYRNAPDILDQTWLAFLDDTEVLKKTFRPQGVFRPITGSMIIEGLVPILNQILDVLSDLRPYGGRPAWTKDLGKGDDVSVLGDQLQEALFFKKVQPPKISDAHVPEQVQQYAGLAGKALAVEDWLPMFGFPGWTTEFLQVSPQGVGDMPRK